jgi:6-phosphofructokinase
VIEVFKVHNVGYFFYIGGNDSMDTAHKGAKLAGERALTSSYTPNEGFLLTTYHRVIIRLKLQNSDCLPAPLAATWRRIYS